MSLLGILLNTLLTAAGAAALPHALLARMRLYVELVVLLDGMRRRLGLWVVVSDLLGSHEAGRNAGSGAVGDCAEHFDYCGGRSCVFVDGRGVCFFWRWGLCCLVLQVIASGI